MNLLFVIPYVPNPVRVRPFQLIRALAQRGHHVHLLTLTTSAADESDLTVLREVCQSVMALPMPTWRSALNCLAAIPGKTPLQAVFSWNSELAKALELRIGGKEPFDIVHVEHLRGSRYALLAESSLMEGTGTHPAVVWDAVDSISLLFQQAMQRSASLKSRLLTRFELPRTRQAEQSLSEHFDRILVTSPVDRDAFLKTNKQASERIRVVPNGVDTEYFRPNPDLTRDPDHIVITGKMSYHANVSLVKRFVERILPRIWAQIPQAKLSLVGKDPPPGMVALAQDPRIRVTGTVADIRPYLWRAAVAAAPLSYGVGIQNKVLEAMACATPVVSTPQAVSALGVTPGVDVLCAESDQELSDCIVSLLRDPVRQNAIGAAGYRFVRSHHRWDKIVLELEGIYGEAIDIRSADRT